MCGLLRASFSIKFYYTRDIISSLRWPYHDILELWHKGNKNVNLWLDSIATIFKMKWNSFAYGHQGYEIDFRMASVRNTLTIGTNRFRNYYGLNLKWSFTLLNPTNTAIDFRKKGNIDLLTSWKKKQMFRKHYVLVYLSSWIY